MVIAPEKTLPGSVLNLLEHVRILGVCWQDRAAQEQICKMSYVDMPVYLFYCLIISEHQLLWQKFAMTRPALTKRLCTFTAPALSKSTHLVAAGWRLCKPFRFLLIQKSLAAR